jgi:hypothetical protein
MPIGGCATASFAPPPVNPQYQANAGGPAGCTVTNSNAAISHDVAGAMRLTDNFIYAYRCSARQLAEGRQFFQVPAFFAAVAGLIGPTLGMSNDAVLLTGAGAGVLNTGNSYYAPRAKLGVLSSALRALVCVKTEAAGISYFKTEQPAGDANTRQAALSQALQVLKTEEARLVQEAPTTASAITALALNRQQQRQIAGAMTTVTLEGVEQASDGSIFIDAETQYFEMVSGALFSVEAILGERLRDAGSADTSDIFAKLKDLAKAHADAEAKLEAAKKKAAGSSPAGGSEALFAAAPDVRKALVKLENADLQPRLQVCVLQARV